MQSVLYCWFWSYALFSWESAAEICEVCICYYLHTASNVKISCTSTFKKKKLNYVPLSFNHFGSPKCFSLSISIRLFDKTKINGVKKKIKQWNNFCYFNLRLVLYSSVLKLGLLASKAYTFNTTCGNAVALFLLALMKCSSPNPLSSSWIPYAFVCFCVFISFPCSHSTCYKHQQSFGNWLIYLLSSERAEVPCQGWVEKIQSGIKGTEKMPGPWVYGTVICPLCSFKKTKQQSKSPWKD